MLDTIYWGGEHNWGVSCNVHCLSGFHTYKSFSLCTTCTLHALNLYVRTFHQKPKARTHLRGHLNNPIFFFPLSCGVFKVFQHLSTFDDIFVINHLCPRYRAIQKFQTQMNGFWEWAYNWELAIVTLLGLKCNEHYERPMWPAELGASCAE